MQVEKEECDDHLRLTLLHEVPTTNCLPQTNDTVVGTLVLGRHHATLNDNPEQVALNNKLYKI